MFASSDFRKSQHRLETDSGVEHWEVALKKEHYYQDEKELPDWTVFVRWKKLGHDKKGAVFRGRELVCACLPPKRPASKTGRHQDQLAPV